MARLRGVGPGERVSREELRAAVTGGAGGRADPRRPERILAGLLADGLVATDDDGATYRLP